MAGVQPDDQDNQTIATVRVARLRVWVTQMATKGRKATARNESGAGEFRTGPIAGTALLDGLTFRSKPVLYADIDGQAMFEGDIVVGPVEDIRRAGDSGVVLQSLGLTGSQFRWPDATVAFTIDGGLTNQSRVTDAIAHWEANTRIRFAARDAAVHSNWVNFVSGGGCSSNVGMRGSQQNITLGSGCSTGNAIHEIGHALGLWHEQSREDRDTFVQIVFANIDPSFAHNFTQHITDGDDLGPYDYGSLMHYPPTAFSTNGQATIIALQPIPAGVVMGQRNGLSAGDIGGIHTLYPAPSITIKEATADPVFTRKELVKEPTTDPVFTRKEAIADPVFTRKELLKEPVKDPAVDPVTVKEAAFDPIFPGGFPRFPFPGPDPRFATTFITGAPSRVGGMSEAASGATDAVQQLADQVEQLGQALAAIEQQHAALASAYDEAAALLAQMQGQG